MDESQTPKLKIPPKAYTGETTVISARLPKDMIAIRVNVDEFDEAYDILISHGFKNFYGKDTVATSSSKSAMMLSPSGFAINLVQHIK